MGKNKVEIPQGWGHKFTVIDSFYYVWGDESQNSEIPEGSQVEDKGKDIIYYL